ncbi:hypothetical protein AB0C41_09070 [Micromonospora taraxaci]|uniref:TolB family protein n=1 Tax=Micromonospora taraxaci TaxID=1316803 RepID=UPI0033F6B7AE
MTTSAPGAVPASQAGAAASLAGRATTTRVSVSSAGAEGRRNSYTPAISAAGRYVAFLSRASNLVPGDTNEVTDVFVHDLVTGKTERVSVSSSGSQQIVNGAEYAPSISADGRYVVFLSEASNLVPGDTNNTWDVFRRDRVAGTTERVNLTSTGGQANGPVYEAILSADGQSVAFVSRADNLVPGDTNGTDDVFVRDLRTATTSRVSVSGAGGQANGRSQFRPGISADGRYVAFLSEADNLVPGDTNRLADYFVRDRTTSTTSRVNVSSTGMQSRSLPSSSPAISANGRYVIFEGGDDLVPDDYNDARDVFLRDRTAGTTERVSLTNFGGQANDRSYALGITADGRYVVFSSWADNLVPDDTNPRLASDVYVREERRVGPTPQP